MKGVVGMIVMAGMWAAAPALAVDVGDQSPRAQSLSLRQIKGCMVKRMLADRSVAYIQAKKMCSDQLRAQSDATPRPLAAVHPGAGLLAGR